MHISMNIDWFGSRRFLFLLFARSTLNWAV
jgi:hypothetical protein